MADSQLPRGTVTFLFTDIEGSTRLIDKLGEEGYVQALADHRHLLRSAFSAHGGVEVDTQGDAFLYAFADPVDALAAATEAQQALASGSVKVRMGLHTGEPRLTGEGYAGRELHRAARIAACGHGGQIVLSAATRALVDGDLSDLGEHRLKDFLEPVALFQLGQQRFPPLKTISNTNLPRPASSFVGRQRERDDLVGLFRNGTRLVTLSGPGGSGKTRLALEVASELVPDFKAGVFWVGLAALRDPALVTEAIAQTLAAKDGLAEQIAERELLLLLDNFEQVVEAAPELGRLLERCPNLKLMVTSRELLRISGELEYPVPPLAEPEAVELFCARSQLEPDETIAELCRRLDDLPLALELAAARTSVLSPAQILERLAQRLDLLTGGRDADPRQQTLRATIAWSHDLLDDAEQALFARLAVFNAGCTLEAAQEVADADLDTLQSLVEKSLLRHTNERFWMLETIWEYAVERLEASSEADKVRQRHLAYFLAFAEGANADGWRGVELALKRLEAEQANFRSALAECRKGNRSEQQLRFVVALGLFWEMQGHFSEGLSWLEEVLAGDAMLPDALRAKALGRAAWLAMGQGDFERAERYASAQLVLGRALGSELEIAGACSNLGGIARWRSDFDTAQAHYEEALAMCRKMGDVRSIASQLGNLGDLAFYRADYARAQEIFEEILPLDRGEGTGQDLVIDLVNLAQAVLCQGRAQEALDPLDEALSISARPGSPVLAGLCLEAAGFVLQALGKPDASAITLGAAAAIRAEIGLALAPFEATLREQAVASLKQELTQPNFERYWTRGEDMSPEQATSHALAVIRGLLHASRKQ